MTGESESADSDYIVSHEQIHYLVVFVTNELLIRTEDVCLEVESRPWNNDFDTSLSTPT